MHADFVSIGEHLAFGNWGWPDQESISSALQSVCKDNDSRQVVLLAAIMHELRSMNGKIGKLPRQITDAIAKGEERICKARENAAKAELEAKQSQPVTHVCANEILDMIPVKRLRGKW